MLSAILLGGAIAAQPPLSAKPDLDKQPTLYIVGYAHLDTQWRWSFPQTIGEFLPNTMHDNFKLFEQYPGYTFNFTGSNRYRLMKEYWPNDYARLKQYVAEGKWFPAGSSVEEGDVNSPSLESLVRQVLYGNEYFDKEFGKHSDEYMLPDCFGFPAALPSILAHCGVKGFSTQKLTWGSAVGIPFNLGVWVGPDGKGVVAALNPGSYGSRIGNDLSHDAHWIERVNKDGADSGVYADYMYYGTGDVGGSPTPDSVAWAEKSATGTGPLKVIGGRADQLFNDLTPANIAKLPRYKGDLELTNHSAGSLTSESEHKKWNHENEKLAQAAEEAAVSASLVRHSPYPSARLLNAWYLFLAGQFHDTMAGTAIPKAYSYAWNDDCIAQNEFASTLDNATADVARALDTRGPGEPLVVFNPTSFRRTDLVTAEVAASPKQHYVVRTPSGSLEPAQVVEGGKRILFAADSPGVGFGVYHLLQSGQSAPSVTIGKRHVLENAQIRVTVGPSGDITSVYDKRARRETLAGPIRLALMHENPENWPAWNMDWADQSKPPYAYVGGPAKITLEESGPLRGAIRVERQGFGSRFGQVIRLAKDSPRVEIVDDIDWKTSETALKQEFHLAAANQEAAYNWQVGVIRRGNNDPKKFEVASHRWFDLTDRSGRFGGSVLTGSKIGSDKPDDRTVRLTLLYSPGVHGGYQDQYSQDWGHHEIRYGFLPHSGDWRAAKTAQQAAELDQPFLAFHTDSHPGPAGRRWSLASLSSPHVCVTAVKKAENGDSTIVRVRENDGQARSNVVLEIATPILFAQEVDGQERPIGPAQLTHGKLRFGIGAFGVKAFKLTLASYSRAIAPAKSKPVALTYNADVMSTPTDLSDGDFDGSGRTIASDQLPATLRYGSVEFKLGPRGSKRRNAVLCEGQTIRLPAGNWHSVHLLAAAVGPQSGTFAVGGRPTRLTVADWSGDIGQWDTRVWQGEVPKMVYNWDNELLGIEPGFVRRDPIVWNSSHRHDPMGNEIYQYSYLFDYALQATGSSVRLPRNSKIKVLAMSVCSDPASETSEASQEVVQIHERQDAPRISPGGGRFSDSVFVTLQPGLYGRSDQIMYSLNGSRSQRYTGPFEVSSDAKIRAHIGAGPGAGASITVNDITPPKVTIAQLWPALRLAEVRFSEPVREEDAQNPANYKIPGTSVESARLSADGESVVLSLGGDPTPGDASFGTIRDRSPRGNRLAGSSPLAVAKPAAEVPSYSADGKSLVARSDDLPVAARAPWTLNFLVRTDEMPEDRTPIAGFGQSADDVSGASRLICKFRNGLRFWGKDIDIVGHAPLDLHRWQMLTATYDGRNVAVYKDGKLLTSEPAALSDAPPYYKLAPVDGWSGARRFKGEFRDFTIWPESMDSDAVERLYKLELSIMR